MRRHRSSAPPPESSSSDDDDDDAFSAFSNSKKNKRKQKKKSKANLATVTKNKSGGENEEKPKLSSTNGSIRRHHGTSSARQAKMDAMLLDLEKEKEIATSTSAASNNVNASGPGHYGPSSYNSRPPPDKRGSFVEEGDELLTTNIFVGNLAPSVTEEALTDLFRQFGEIVDYLRYAFLSSSFFLFCSTKKILIFNCISFASSLKRQMKNPHTLF